MDVLNEGDTGSGNSSTNSQMWDDTDTIIHDEDPFVSCQVNISIVKTLTEDLKLYRSTVNKEYVTCGPLSSVHKSNAPNPEQTNYKPYNDIQSGIVHDAVDPTVLKPPSLTSHDDEGVFEEKKNTSFSIQSLQCI